MHMLLMLLAAHALCDYPLQGEFLSQGKNSKISGVPWYQCMTAHCLIHAGAVTLVTGIWGFGVLEFVLHFMIDYMKVKGLTSFNEDQAMHVGCKLVYVTILALS